MTLALVISAILFEENSMGEMPTGGTSVENVITLLFELDDYAGTISKNELFSMRWRNGTKKVYAAHAE
jgi:hypothetical protein